MLYAVFTPTKRAKIMAPVAWFMSPEDAHEYTQYLTTIKEEALVVDQPKLTLEGEESLPEGWPMCEPKEGTIMKKEIAVTPVARQRIPKTS